MEEADIPVAVKLTDLERWGYGEADFRRFLRMDPDGALVAVEGSRPVGLAVATLYGPVAWVGSIVVDPEARGRGHGKALVEGALTYAQEGGAETVWLNAYPHAEAFYESLGFRSAGETLHLEGTGPGEVQPEVRLAHAGDLAALAAFDRPFFGVDRAKVLQAFYYDYGEAFHIRAEEDIRGYIVGAPTSEGVEIAPWVADPAHPQAAEDLFLHLLAQFPEAAFALNVPAENAAARSIAERRGFAETFRTVRMHHGPDRHGIDAQGTFSLGGLEKG